MKTYLMVVLLLLSSSLGLKLIESEKDEKSVAIIEDEVLPEYDQDVEQANTVITKYVKYGQGRNTSPYHIVYSTRRIQDYQKGGLSMVETINLKNSFDITADLAIPYTFVRHFFGYGLILSKDTNPYCASSTCYLGYESVTKALALRVDLNFFSWVKIPTPTMCIHTCISDPCTNADCVNIDAPTTFQIQYDTPWRGVIRLTYEPADQIFEVYLNGQSFKKYNINLQDYMGITPTLSFTANGKRYGADMKIMKLDVVETKSTATLPNLGILVDGELSSNPKFDAGQTFYVYLKFSCKEYAEQNTGYLTTDCGKISSISVYKSSTTERQAVVSECNVPGKYNVTFTDANIGTTTTSFTINDIPFASLGYYGHDSIEDRNGYTPKTDIEVNLIRYGTMPNKDFKLDDFTEGVADINFAAYDTAGNQMDAGNIAATIKTKFAISIKDPLINTVNYTITRVGSGKTCFYSLKFNVTSTGEYLIQSSTFSSVGNFKLRIYDDKPTAASYCKITNSNRTNLKQNVTIVYKCYYYDSFGGVINEQSRKNYFDFTPIIRINKKGGSLQDLSVVASGNEFDGYYVTQYQGTFELHGYYKKGTVETEVSNLINTFSVLPEPDRLVNAELYSFSDKNWYVNIDSLSTFEFDYSDNQQKSMFAINFIYSDGSKFSDVGYGNFDKSQLSAYVTSEHVLVTGEILDTMTVTFGTIDNKTVVLLSLTKDRDEVFRRSSFVYYINILFKNDTIKIPLTFGPLKNNKIVSCHHSLSGAKSYLDVQKTSYEVSVGTDLSLGTLYLRTVCDYLYNYEAVSKISYNLSTDDGSIYSSYYYVKVKADSNINGANQISVMFQKVGTYSIKFMVEGKQVVNGAITVKAKALTKAYRIESTIDMNKNYSQSGNVFTYNSKYTADQTPEIYYKAYDRYDNQILGSSNPGEMGITVSVKKGNTQVTDISNKFSYKYYSTDKKNSFKDSIKDADSYSATLTCKANTNQTVTFKYDRIEGRISANKSVVNYIGPSRINQQTYTYVLISMYDSYGNKITNQSSYYYDDIKSLVCNAVNDDGTTTQSFSYISYSGNEVTFKNDELFEKQGTYTVKGYVESNQIKNVISSIFTMKKNDYDFFNSIISMFYEKLEQLNPHTNYFIRIQQNDPIFYFEFYNSAGDKITDLGNDTDVSLELKMQDTLEFIKLEGGWVDKGTKYFQIPSDRKNALAGKKALLTVNEDESKEITLIFATNNETGTGNSTDLSNTMISEQNLTLIAGEKQTIIIEIRDSDGKRNENIDNLKDLITYEVSDPDLKIHIEIKESPLDGQVIVEISQEKVNSYSNANVITFKYNGTVIQNKEVYVITEPGEFDHFDIDQDSLKDPDTKQLIDGDTSSTTDILFTPLDKYNNSITKFFDTDNYAVEDFYRYFEVTHKDGYPVDISSGTVDDSKIKLKIHSDRSGELTIKSKYLKDEYTMDIYPSDISSDSTGYVDGDNPMTAGEKIDVVVEPRDENGNKIDDIDEEDLKDFVLEIKDEDGNVIDTITDPVIDPDTKNIIYKDVPINKTGEITIEVKYKDEPIIIDDDVVIVTNAAIDYNATVLIYSDIEYKTTLSSPSPTVAKSTLPKFYFKFFDIYKNEITDVSNINIKSIDYSISQGHFCSGDQGTDRKIAYICPTQVDNYLNAHKTSGGKDKFTLTIDDSKKIFYYVTINSGSETISSKPVDYDKTYISTKTIETETGEYYEFYIELRDEDGKITSDGSITADDLDSYFKFDYTDDHEQYHHQKVIQGEKKGQYIIMIESDKVFDEGEDSLTISIKGDDGEFHEIAKNIDVIVEPSDVEYCYFMDSKGTPITSGALPDAKADESYILKATCYDKFGNKGTADQENIFTIKNTDPIKGKYDTDYDAKVLSDGTIYINSNPIYKGDYTIDSSFFNKDGKSYSYTFKTIAGDVSAENSIIDVADSAIAGEDFYAYVTLYDDFGNQITASEAYKSTFEVYFQDFEDTESFYTYGEYKTVEYYKVDTDKNALVFKVVLHIYGENIFYGVSKNDKIPIKCKNCYTFVTAGAFSLEHSYLYILDSSIDEYELLSLDYPYQNYEENSDRKLILNLYPADKYGNPIDFTDGLTLSSYKIGDVSLDLVDNGDSWTLTTDSDVYHALTGGQYQITIKDSKETLARTITLAGDKNADFYTDQTLDESKTQVIDSDLEFKAGEYGYMYLQLRTKNNVRYFSSAPTNIEVYDCKGNQLTLDTPVYSEGLIYVRLSSTHANTYPYYTECKLNIKINDNANYIDSHPLIKVSPASIYRAEIVSTYIETGHQLKSISTDEELMFEVAAYDKYDNLAKSGESKISLELKLGNTAYDIKSVTNILTGYQKYYTSVTDIGTYDITAGKNSDDTNLFPDDGIYTVEVKSGSIDTDSSTVTVIDKSIEAGDTTKIRIQPKDKSGNIIDLEEAAKKLVVSIDDGDKTITPSYEIKDDYIEFSADLTIKGDHTWEIKLDDGEEIPCNDCDVKVEPTDCDPSKTVVYSKDKDGNEQVYTKDKHLYSSVTDGFEFELELKDKYGNIIDDIDDTVATLKDMSISGNDMEQDIKLKYDVNADGDRLVVELDSDDSDNMDYFKRLVTLDDYELKFTVDNGKGNATDFKYYVDHEGLYTQPPYGNGVYDPLKTLFEENSIKMKAGEEKSIKFTLKTENGKTYTNNLDVSKMGTKSTVDEFNTSISPQGVNTGEYYVTVQSNVAGSGTVTVSIEDPTTKTKVDVQDISVIVNATLPDPSKTIHSSIGKIKLNQPGKLTVTLTDKYGNQYKDFDYEDIIPYLTVINNNKEVSDATFKVSSDDPVTLEVSFNPLDSISGDASMNIKINKDGEEYYLFPEDEVFTIISELSYEQTKFVEGNLYKMVAGDKLNTTLKFYTKDNKCYSDDKVKDFKVYAQVTGPLDGESQTYLYPYTYYEDQSSDCIHGFKLNIEDKDRYTTAGSYSVNIYIDEGTKTTLKSATQTVVPGIADINSFRLKSEEEGDTPMSVKTTDHFTMTLYSYDAYGNFANQNKIYNTIAMKVRDTDGVVLDDYDVVSEEIATGIIQYDMIIYKLGTYNFEFTYNSLPATYINSGDLKNVVVKPGKCSKDYKRNINESFAEWNNSITGVPVNVYLTCYDYKNNAIQEGGANFDSSVVLTYVDAETEILITVNVKTTITDNGDGTYVISFTPPIDGEYSINVYLDNEKYIDGEIVREIKADPCEGTSTPIQCPNGNFQCVDDILKCIPEDERGPNKTYPFKCKVSGVTKYVKSRYECDCPDGYVHCGIFQICVPSDKTYLCPYHAPVSCESIGLDEYKQCADGICRTSCDYIPSPKVCPIGSVLCPDLTCRSSLDQCASYSSCSGLNGIKCEEQSCVEESGECPSFVTCTNIGNVVCPDGSCVSNEIYCGHLTVCPTDKPFLCASNVCAKNKDNCPTSITCGHGASLCEDDICREVCE